MMDESRRFWAFLAFLFWPWLVVMTTVILLAVTTGVSYLPARRILRYRATEALRGKLL